jgi:EAL domain-containing protein (putative c-di-GMP-specific phosphodiesterase class I)/GGDEF domain-containing protein
MLVSEQEERSRKFKLALRTGLPVLLLIALVAYSILYPLDHIRFGLREFGLTAALVFVTTYFIFFLLEEDGQKTLIDRTTNGFNYPAFLHYYERRMPRSLGMLQIHNLAIINENYGAEEIDRMLRSLVYQLDGTLTARGMHHAVIARKHGAEFLVGCDAPAQELRETLRAFVNDHPSIEEIEIDYRYETLDHPESPLEKAVWRLHDAINAAAQASSRSPSETVSDHSNHTVPNRNEEAITEAIRAKRVVFTFRPLYHVRTDRIDTYEIAVRIRLDNAEELAPRDYLPVVNRLGLGREYDYAILEHIIRLLPLVDDTISFSFNLSPFSLRNKDFQTKAFALLSDSDIDPSRLIIELYERKTHHNLEGYLKTLEAFRARGVRICIDNFGSSNASMEYMRHFKFDMVQFDRDYVGHLDDPSTSAMLRSMIEMSRDLHIATVAKWVDKAHQKKQLIAMGIDYLQGFGIAKPLSEAQLIDTYN